MSFPLDRPALRRAAPGSAIAVLAVLAGGALAAAFAHAPSRPMMWLVAYLVLVVGVAQAALTLAQAGLALRTPSVAMVVWQCVAFNLANALVIAGTLLAQPVAVTVGAVLLVVALALFARAVRGARGWPAWVFRALVGWLGVSALVGVGLALWRASS